jgi:hypothetical protein
VSEHRNPDDRLAAGLEQSPAGLQKDNVRASSDHEPDLILHLSHGNDISGRKARQDADQSVEREFFKGNHLIGSCGYISPFVT